MNKNDNIEINKISEDISDMNCDKKLLYSQDKKLFKETIDVFKKNMKFEKLLSNLKAILIQTKEDKTYLTQSANEKSICFLSLNTVISEIVKELEKIKNDFATFNINQGFDFLSFNKKLLDFVCINLVNDCIIFKIDPIELKRVVRNIIKPYRLELIYGATSKEKNEQIPKVINEILSKTHKLDELKGSFLEIINNLQFYEEEYDYFVKKHSKSFANIICKLKLIVNIIENLDNKGYNISKDFDNKNLNIDLETFILNGKSVKFDDFGFLNVEQGKKIFQNNLKKKITNNQKR